MIEVEVPTIIIDECKFVIGHCGFKFVLRVRIYHVHGRVQPYFTFLRITIWTKSYFQTERRHLEKGNIFIWNKKIFFTNLFIDKNLRLGGVVGAQACPAWHRDVNFAIIVGVKSRLFPAFNILWWHFYVNNWSVWTNLASQIFYIGSFHFSYFVKKFRGQLSSWGKIDPFYLFVYKFWVSIILTP